MLSVNRAVLVLGFGMLMTAAAWQDLWPPEYSARVEIVTEGRMPARLYLWKGNASFRLAPVDAVLPIRSDTYYRDRFFSRVPNPKVMEVIARDQYHYLLLKGEGTFFLPPGEYRIEAYRGLFYTPAVEKFTLTANDNKRIVLKLQPWQGVNPKEWITADDHIHLTRNKQEDPVFLDWLAAEDLTVGNFLQLQRQMDAAVQYGFGKPGEARRNGYVIRSGQELRNEFWGHTNILGHRELIRPMSTGSMYANSPESWPTPTDWFLRGRQLGGLTGYAHFFQPPQHSSIYLDAALGNIDFVEVFQFGVLKTEPWYELLNAGLKVTGVAGSDFPVYLNNKRPWPEWIPLLGPERAMVKAAPGDNSFEAWAKGVKEGKVVVSNGPIVEMTVDEGSGQVTATASFWRPLESLEIVRNGEVIAQTQGGQAKTLTVSATASKAESCWLAARVKAQTLKDEPPIQAHSNPYWLLKDGKPVRVESSRRALAAKWQAEIDYFRSAGIVFPDASKKQQFFTRAEKALAALR
ncbi:MAG: CehA/McbA family metallohydrolase [Bryobacterales bacterium]|nr:CehA/McbA family metallohydrolase [Bryobacterales bacterium]